MIGIITDLLGSIKLDTEVLTGLGAGLKKLGDKLRGYGDNTVIGSNVVHYVIQIAE